MQTKQLKQINLKLMLLQLKPIDTLRFGGGIFEGVSHVLDFSEGSSKLIPIHEEPNHQIVHLFRLGKTNRAAH